MKMHRLRHVAVVALWGALLLQVSFLGSGMACVLTSAASKPAVAVASSDATGHAGHATHGVTREEAPSRAHDTAPSQEQAPAHCPAAMTCSLHGLLATVDVSPRDDFSRASEIAVSNDAAPASLRGAPEPPPPRA